MDTAHENLTPQCHGWGQRVVANRLARVPRSAAAERNSAVEGRGAQRSPRMMRRSEWKYCWMTSAVDGPPSGPLPAMACARRVLGVARFGCTACKRIIDKWSTRYCDPEGFRSCGTLWRPSPGPHLAGLSRLFQLQARATSGLCSSCSQLLWLVTKSNLLGRRRQAKSRTRGRAL